MLKSLSKALAILVLGICVCGMSVGQEPQKSVVVEKAKGDVKVVTFAYEKDLRVVEAAYVEVVLKAGTEIAVLKRCILRSAEYAEAAGLVGFSVDLKLKAGEVHAPPLCGKDNSVAEARYYRTEAAKVRKKMEGATEDEKAKYLLCAKMLDRTAMFWLKVGHSRGDACLLNELYCRIVKADKVCWNECEIQAAYRIGSSVCAQHGELLAEWMPVLAKVHGVWSVCKASQLGGANDLDAQACTLWLAEMKPYLAKVYPPAELKKLYESPELRTGLWLMTRRGLTCAKEDFYGSEDKLTEDEQKKCVKAAGKEVEENRLALERRLTLLFPECRKLLPTGRPLLPAEPAIILAPCCDKKR